MRSNIAPRTPCTRAQRKTTESPTTTIPFKAYRIAELSAAGGGSHLQEPGRQRRDIRQHQTWDDDPLRHCDRGSTTEASSPSAAMSAILWRNQTCEPMLTGA